MNYVADFFAGLFLCNCIPHLVSGLQGMPFPSPFAKPMGIGNSSPLVNFLWGMSNVLITTYLLVKYPVNVGLDSSFIVLIVGAVAIGSYLAVHFGNVRRSKTPE
jgi:hypothetical protein